MKPINKLFVFTLGGLGACLTMFELFSRKVSSQIKSSNLFEEAMELLRTHKGALYLLGQPITEARAKFNSPGEMFGSDTEIKTFVSGPKSNGILFITLLRDSENKMKINTVQLQVGKDDSKRLVIKGRNEENSGS